MANEGTLVNGPVWRAVLKVALPMMVGILAVMSVAIVDTYFVGKLGSAAQAALSFSFPVSLTLTSLGIGIGAAAASLVSREIGGKDKNSARRFATDSLMLALAVSIGVALLGIFTIKPLFSLLGAQGEELELVSSYMFIWYLSLPFLLVPICGNALIRATGDGFWPSSFMITSAFVNMAITPLLIFGMWGLPELGIEGAAWGTFIARLVSFFLPFIIIVWRERLISTELPSKEQLSCSFREVTRIAGPAGLGNMAYPLGTMVVTAILAAYGSETVAAFGVATRLEALFCIPMLAFSSAIGPVAGQNWGADERGRVLKSLQFSYGVCLAWTIIITLVFWFAGETLAGFLAANDEIAKEAALYLYIVPVSLFGYGISVVAAGAYNSLGRPLTGLATYAFRIVLLYIPLAFTASLIADSWAVYIAIAVANAASGVVIAVYSLKWVAIAKREKVPNIFLKTEYA